MGEKHIVKFDASTAAGGRYYTGGETAVLHLGRPCRVVDVKSRGGSRRTAWLEEIDSPTPDQVAAAEAWDRRTVFGQ